MTTQAHLELFQNTVDVIQHSGGTIGNHPGIVDMIMSRRGLIAALTSDAEKAEVAKEAQDEYLAIAFLLHADRTRYSSMLQDYENDFLQGQDNYPKTVTAAYNVLTNWKQDPHKVLARHEKEKKDKYVEPCLARRRTFTPLVFSVDGLRGAEASAASKKLASRLSAKWKRAYSEVCGFVRSRLAITLVRTTSQCLRGARDPTARASHATWETGAGLALYQ